MPASQKKSLLHLYLIMAISLIIASVLSVYPLSASIAVFRPMWLVIALIFWLIFQPTLVGVWLAFAIGFITDCLTDSRLGQQALCAVIVAFFIKWVSGYLKQLSATSVWVLASGCLLLYQVSLIVLQLFTQAIFAPQVLYSALISILVWPLWVSIFSRYTH